MYYTRSIAHEPTFLFSQKRVISEMSGMNVYVVVSYLMPLIMENRSLKTGSMMFLSTVWVFDLTDLPWRHHSICKSLGSFTFTWAVPI